MSKHNEIEEKEDVTPSGDKWFKVYYMGMPVDTIPAPNMDEAVKYLKSHGIRFSRIVPL